MNCWHCGAEIEVKERVGFRDGCIKCDRPLHVCRNCGFYDPTFHNQCRETQAEMVADKERANFCEFFAPRQPGAAVSGAKRPPQSDARSRLDALFTKKS